MSTAVKWSLSLCHVAIFFYGFHLQRDDKDLSDINTIGFSIYCSRGAALCLAFDMALIMLPVCRKLLSYISRISFALLGLGHGTISEGSQSRMTAYHKYMAYHVLAFLTIHVLGHCVNFYRLEQLGRGPAVGYHFQTWAGVTGYGMLLLLGIMYTTAHSRIRQRKYELFWYTHHLALVVMVLFSFHGYGCFVKTNEGQCRGYRSWRYVVLVSLIYLVERVLRAYEGHPSIALSSAIAHPGGAIELNFKHPSMHYRPGQHVYLNIPRLSKHEWHPFTITSSPIEPYISLDIRQDGDWTGNLGRLFGHGPETPRLEEPRKVLDRSLLPLIKIDGPYGGPKEDVLTYDHAVLIGTGNGITTFSGILRHIWFRHQETQSSRLQTLDLYWISRDANKLDWFQALFSMEKTLELFRTGLIRIHIYFTSTKAIPRRTLSRKPGQPGRSARDAPPLLPNLRTIDIVRRRYSEDDDEHEEEAELLSPWEDHRLGSGLTHSLISLTSIHSLPLSEHPSSFPGDSSTAPPQNILDSEERATRMMEEGEAIIGPHNIHYGRPDFAAIFDMMKHRIAQGSGTTSPPRESTTVGVFYCGSPGLGRTLARECKQVNSSRVRFEFNEE
ncbi:ferric-chelate reductase [Entomortierella parvispora]|uniref:Ferric-chelate reductase n=1 Tax=Entomortierella parvispora TaxID=205924 RepID=A0A9P3LTX4_9FUNG|nr:ferric-chelate reductase [Entomortierella parvispora]